MMVEVAWRNLSPHNKYAGKIADRIGAARPQKVAVRDPQTANLCYWNVARKVEQEGGQLVFGWRLQWVPDVIVEAQHHAVWRSPEGILIDITEPPPRSSGFEWTTFIEDKRQQPDLAFPPRLNNQFLVISHDPLVRSCPAASDEQMAAYRELVSAVKVSGGSYDSTTGELFDGPGGRGDINAYLAAIDATADKLGPIIVRIMELASRR